MPRPCRGLEWSLSERHIHGMAGERHGNDMVCANQTQPHCVNQMGKTQSKPLAGGMAGERHGMCESALSDAGKQQTLVTAAMLLLSLITVPG
jgi:hypothetical protein